MNRKNSSGNIEYIYSHPASGEQPEEEELIQHSALPIREILRRLNALLAKTRCEDARHYLQMWQRCARGKRDWGSELVLCSELLCLLRHMKDKDAADPIVRDQVRKLQAFITENYYTCTKEILSGLGKMYAGGGDFTKNIDSYGGEGTAEFVHQAIEIYCK